MKITQAISGALVCSHCGSHWRGGDDLYNGGCCSGDLDTAPLGAGAAAHGAAEPGLRLTDVALAGVALACAFCFMAIPW